MATNVLTVSFFLPLLFLNKGMFPFCLPLTSPQAHYPSNSQTSTQNLPQMLLPKDHSSELQKIHALYLNLLQNPLTCSLEMSSAVAPSICLLDLKCFFRSSCDTLLEIPLPVASARSWRRRRSTTPFLGSSGLPEEDNRSSYCGNYSGYAGPPAGLSSCSSPHKIGT